jgi:hypothetical protein
VGELSLGDFPAGASCANTVRGPSQHDDALLNMTMKEDKGQNSYHRGHDRTRPGALYFLNNLTDTCYDASLARAAAGGSRLTFSCEWDLLSGGGLLIP